MIATTRERRTQTNEKTEVVPTLGVREPTGSSGMITLNYTNCERLVIGGVPPTNTPLRTGATRK